MTIDKYASAVPNADAEIAESPATTLVAKLRIHANLSAEDVAALNELCSDIRTAKAGYKLVREGECPEYVYLLIEGWGYRYKILPDGRRQIVAYILPGDLGDLHSFTLKAMDHSIGLLSDATYARISKERVDELLSQRPPLAKVLLWSTLADQAILREWIVNLGQRNPYERVAHLFAELWLRLRMVGLTNDGSFEIRITQAELADTMGLTAIHINRVLQRMRADGLITIRRGWLTVENMRALMDAVNFKSAYLHLETWDGKPPSAPAVSDWRAAHSPTSRRATAPATLSLQNRKSLATGR